MENLVDILIFIGIIGWTVISMIIKQKKENSKSAIPKNMQQPFNEEDTEPTAYIRTENKKATNIDNSKPFSYETMSDREFKEEFDKNNKQDFEEVMEKGNSENILDFSEGEIYKGIVYSEILRKKYC